MNILTLAVLLNTDNTVRLSFDSVRGAHYRVVATSPVTGTTWTTLTNMLGTGETMTFNVPRTSPQRYFQVIMRTNPLIGKTLYVEQNTPARQQATAWRDTRPEDAAQMMKIADQPTAVWINSSSDVAKIGQTFSRCGTRLPIFNLYNIYQRDYQGGFSTGGASSPLAYTNFVNSCRTALAAKECVVVLEPDALAALDGLPAADQTKRIELLNYAVERLSSLSTVFLYGDVGHPHWKDVATMTSRLRSIGAERLRGFSLNVSNFIWTNECITYGTSISQGLSYLHFIIDTSRNGRGPTPDYAWCNPPDRGLGKAPTAETGNPLVDAYLYLKYPGESDGTCFGGPPSGQWFPEYALTLCRNAVQ